MGVHDYHRFITADKDIRSKTPRLHDIGAHRWRITWPQRDIERRKFVTFKPPLSNEDQLARN